MRAVQPAVVFTHSPQDYLIDHEVTSALARNAAFFAGVPNVKTDPHPPFRPVPHVDYADAGQGLLQGVEVVGDGAEEADFAREIGWGDGEGDGGLRPIRG